METRVSRMSLSCPRRPARTLLLLLNVIAPGDRPANEVCEVLALERNPEGYVWPLANIQRFVDSAEVIVRARAVDSVTVENPQWAGWYGRAEVTFTILETVKGQKLTSLTLPGSIVDHDDFNRESVPYRIVRPSGQRGSCVTGEYKLGGEYLFILRTRNGSLTPYWAPLAPLNEQIRGAEDPWVRWVRFRVSA